MTTTAAAAVVVSEQDVQRLENEGWEKEPDENEWFRETDGRTIIVSPSSSHRDVWRAAVKWNGDKNAVNAVSQPVPDLDTVLRLATEWEKNPPEPPETEPATTTHQPSNK